MNIVIWVMLGVLAGLISIYFIKTENEDRLTDLSLGILGALVGGFIINIFAVKVSLFSPSNLIIAELGAIVLIWLGRTLRKA